MSASGTGRRALPPRRLRVPTRRREAARPASRGDSARRRLALLLLLVVVAVSASPAREARAGEGAGSHYMPGVSGDFAMTLVGPPGFYLRNDVAWFTGRVKAVTLGDRVFTSANQSVWVDVAKLTWLASGGVLGGRFGTVVAVPAVIDATVGGRLVEPVEKEVTGSVGGFSDVSFMGFLNWGFGRSHVMTGLNVYAPVGRYDENRIVNLGRNYWSIVPTAAYTWLDPESGREASITTSVFFNTANDATGYRSGNEWSADFLLGQHVSRPLAFAVEGAALVGITDDSGALLDRANALLPAAGVDPLGGFRARYFGLGPAVLWSPKLFGHDVNLIAKYLFDVVHENRFNSKFLVMSFAFGF